MAPLPTKTRGLRRNPRNSRFRRAAFLFAGGLVAVLGACASSRRCPGCVGTFGTDNATCTTVGDICGAEAHALVRTGDGVALACLGFRQYPTFAHGSSPILTARPAGFEMAWLSETTVNVARLSVQGRMIGVPTKVPIPFVGEPRDWPSIAATADGYGILWSERDTEDDSRSLVFARIDPAAARVGERQQVLKLPLQSPSSRLVATERGFAFAFIAGDGTRTGGALAVVDAEGKLLRVYPVATVEGTVGKLALVFARGVFVVAWSEDFLFGPSHRHEIRSIRLDAESRPLTPVQTAATVAEMLGVTDLVVGRFNDSDSVAYNAAVALDASGIDGWHLVDLSRRGEEGTWVPSEVPDLVWTPGYGVVATSKSLDAFLRLASIRNLLAFKDGRGLVVWMPPNTDAIQVAPVCSR